MFAHSSTSVILGPLTVIGGCSRPRTRLSTMSQQCSIGFRSGEQAGQSMASMPSSPRQSIETPAGRALRPKPLFVLKMHGPVLRTSPVTISNFLCVPHYYWGAGRPEWVSGSITTVVPCPPSGLQFRLHVGYRTTLVQSLNQCQIDL